MFDQWKEKAASIATDLRRQGAMTFMLVFSVISQWLWLLYVGIATTVMISLASTYNLSTHMQFTGSVVLCYAIILFYFYRLFIREQRKAEDFSFYERTIAELYTNTRLFRHEFRNRLLVLEGYYQSQDWNGFQQALQYWHDEAEHAHTANADVVSSIENPSLKELLVTTMASAAWQELEFTMDIPADAKAHSALAAQASLVQKVMDIALDYAATSEAKAIALEVTVDRHIGAKLRYTCSSTQATASVRALRQALRLAGGSAVYDSSQNRVIAQWTMIS